MHVILFAVLAGAAYMDLRYERIPNHLIILSFFLSGIFCISGHGVQAVPHYLLSALMPLLVLYPFWRCPGGGLAAGDIKLLMAVSSFLGLRKFMNCFICIFLIAAIPAVVRIFKSQNTGIRLGLPILLGTLAGLLLEDRFCLF